MAKHRGKHSKPIVPAHLGVATGHVDKPHHQGQPHGKAHHAGNSKDGQGNGGHATIGSSHTAKHKQTQQQQQRRQQQQQPQQQQDRGNAAGPGPSSLKQQLANGANHHKHQRHKPADQQPPNANHQSAKPGKGKPHFHKGKQGKAAKPSADTSRLGQDAAANSHPVTHDNVGPKAAAAQPESAKDSKKPAGAGQTAATAAAPVPPVPRKGGAAAVNSNWESLKKVIGATGEGAKKRQADGQGAGNATKKPRSMGSNSGVTPIVAMDCEMVGVGPGGERSALARVCVVNNEGNVLLDTFVQAKETVTDYRTKYSGVRPADLDPSKAITLEEAQRRVAELIKGRTLVGHALSNDLKALMLDHPRKDVRDTSRYSPLMRVPAPGRKAKPRALRHLALQELGLQIQAGEHSPVDDARAALYIYHKHRKDWESAIKSGAIGKVNKQLKAVRAATTAAAAAAMAAPTPGATSVATAAAAFQAAHGARPAAAGASMSVLSAAQRRALRMGRKVKLKPGNTATRSGAGSNVFATGGAASLYDGLDEEIRELAARPLMIGRRGAVDIFSRDVRDDPMADL